MQIPNGVSIVICTYNGVDRLGPTLKAIFSIDISSTIAWELIIIDNASTDNTSEFCRNIIKEYGFSEKVSVVYEPLAGCNHARLRGLKVSKYKWLLFCDDDNHLFPDYIHIGWEILENNSSIGVLGGQGIALFETFKPEWFDRYSKSFAIGPQNYLDGKLQNNKSKLYSAGSFFRREALLVYYSRNFNTIMTGPKGTELSRGEDTEWCMMIELMGYELWYSHNLKFYHFMTNARMKWDYYLRLKAGISSGSAKFVSYTPFFNNTPHLFYFFLEYFNKTLFHSLIWFQFLIRSRITPGRYSKEQLEIGKIINYRKAFSYWNNFRETYRHFKQLQKTLLNIKLNN